MLNSIPDPEERNHVKQIVRREFGLFGSISPQSVVMKKITEGHIDTYLKTRDKSVDYSYKENRNNKVFFIAVLLVVCVALLAIIFLLKDKNPDQMERIITALVAAVLGAAGGFGVGYKKGKDDD